MIEGLQQGLKEDGFTVSISKLCQWFNVPRRTVYYRPRKTPPRLNPAFVEPNLLGLCAHLVWYSTMIRCGMSPTPAISWRST